MLLNCKGCNSLYDGRTESLPVANWGRLKLKGGLLVPILNNEGDGYPGLETWNRNDRRAMHCKPPAAPHTPSFGAPVWVVREVYHGLPQNHAQSRGSPNPSFPSSQ